MPDDNDRWWVTEENNDLEISSDELEDNNSATASSHGDATTCNGGTSSKLFHNLMLFPAFLFRRNQFKLFE